MATVGFQICDVVDCLPRQTDAVGNQECVLLIEDSEDSMLLVRYALQEYGNGTYRLEWAGGLTAGLHRLSKGGVDLVLLDLGLPESSGAASYEAIRSAAPDLPILVLTGDTREQTEFKVMSEGVEDFLVKDEVSGVLLLQAIRTALYSNLRWREHKNSAYKSAPRFVWALEKCQALSSLAIRMLKLMRVESAIGCAKAMAAIVNNYSASDHATIAGRADLFISMEKLARAAATHGMKESSRRFRAMIDAPVTADQRLRDEFEVAMNQRNEELDRQHHHRHHQHGQNSPDALAHDSDDLAQLLRQILESVPSLD
jgi:DNA-binding NarL/FixJ family response regulator